MRTSDTIQLTLVAIPPTLTTFNLTSILTATYHDQFPYSELDYISNRELDFISFSELDFYSCDGLDFNSYSYLDYFPYIELDFMFLDVFTNANSTLVHNKTKPITNYLDHIIPQVSLTSFGAGEIHGT